MEKYSFFNSVNGDRKYKAEDYAVYFSKFITNGVFPNVASNLQVIADSSDMTTKVKAGAAWINGYMYYNDSDLILTHDVADGVLNRIDRIVVKLDYQQRLMKSYIKKGVFASTPVASTLQRDADGYELALADVYIGNGAISITQANVTDLRLNTAFCGMVNSLLQADTTAIFNQYQSWFDQMSTAKEQEFDDWFATVQGQLSGDIAGNLQNQITQLGTDVGDLPTLQTVEKGNLVGAVNEVSQTVVTHLADDVKHLAYATASGTNTYTVAMIDIESLVEGMSVKVKFTNANTGASTLNINSLGAKAIQKGNGNALASGNIKAGQICHLVYTGTVFQLLGEGGEYGNATAPDVLSGKTIGTDIGLVTGTMPNRGTFNLALGATVPAGYYSGGTAPSGKRWANGSTNLVENGSYDYFQVSLPFTPTVIIVRIRDTINLADLMFFYENFFTNFVNSSTPTRLQQSQIYNNSSSINIATNPGYTAFSNVSNGFKLQIGNVATNASTYVADWIAYE